jgi:hypothetical protein
MSADDSILMKLERLCKDFLFTIIKKYQKSMTLKTLRVDDFTLQRCEYLKIFSKEDQKL